MYFRSVVPGGAGGAMASPDFGRSVNPISTKGGRLCPQNNTGTPRFSDLPTALYFHADLPSVPFFTVSWKSAMVYFDVLKIGSDT